MTIIAAPCRGRGRDDALVSWRRGRGIAGAGWRGTRRSSIMSATFLDPAMVAHGTADVLVRVVGDKDLGVRDF